VTGPRFVPQNTAPDSAGRPDSTRRLDSGGESDTGRPDTGSRPIYVWNPTASTDTFPAVDAERG